MTPEQEFLTTHRAHDYRHLIARWRAVARTSGYRIKPFLKEGDYTHYYLEPKRPAASAPAVYLSAGIHGDEPAAPQGLLHWAEQHPRALSAANALIFPCLNPWGLENNVRLNRQGRDLNREFQNPRIPLVREWLKLVAGRQFRLAVNLHEDYDARGMYIYSLSNHREHLAEDIIAAVKKTIAPDPRAGIDGSRAKQGVIRRKIDLDNFPLPGIPEAIYLHFNHSDVTLTVESPSEFSLFDRTRAHAEAIREAIRWLRRHQS